MTYPRVAVIGIPGKWSTETLADALEAKTGFRLVLDMSALWADLATNTLWAGDVNLCKVDAIAVKKINQEYSPDTLDRIELLRIAQAQGVRVFSPPHTIVRMIDRLACTITLRNGHIPMPDTCVTENLDIAFDAVQRFGQAVLKPLYSTKARGMCVIGHDQDPDHVRQSIKAFSAQNPIMYIQRKINLSGRDYGMVFCGGEYLGTYARVAQNAAWNTTIHSGGQYEPHDPPQSTIDLAHKAQSLFSMDFTTVDVADSDEGPIVFEVSAFGGFKGAKDGIGIDAAAIYADYILKQVRP